MKNAVFKPPVHPVLGICSTIYDSNKRPVSFTSDDGQTLVEYSYDYMGRRYMKKVTVNGTVTLHHHYLYRGYLQIAALDLTRSNIPALWFTHWDPTEPVATRPLSIRKNATWYTYGHDLTKNVTELYNASGMIATAYDYTPYGAVTAAGPDQPFQWSSEVYDAELGMVYYNYLHYNPMDGRWIGRDLINLINFSTNIPNYFNINSFNKNLIDKNNNQYSFISNKFYLVDKYGFFGWMGVAGLVLGVGLLIYELKKLADSVDEENETAEEDQDAYDRGDYDEWAKCCDKLQEKRKEKCKRAAKAVEKGLKLVKPKK